MLIGHSFQVAQRFSVYLYQNHLFEFNPSDHFSIFFMSNVIQFSELQKSTIGWEFEGYKFEDTGITFIIVDAAPGEGPRLHSHPYTEIFIVQEGKGLFTIGSKTLEIIGSQILIVPPGVPHKFINTGTGRLRQLDIHLTRKFITNWIENE
jgi:mannose-6-phosphate isomerase-like protein (cupin superfamily)